MQNVLKINRIRFSLLPQRNTFCTGKKEASGQPIPDQTPDGIIFDNKPVKMTLETDKQYSWCLCGLSKKQPLCDGAHKNLEINIKQLRPVRFKVEKPADYFLCNCKHTKKRPFCDGTHKQPHIKSAVKIAE